MTVKNEIPENLVLTTKLLNISIGVVLGDASIQKNTSKTKENYILKFLQGAKKNNIFIIYIMNLRIM